MDCPHRRACSGRGRQRRQPDRALARAARPCAPTPPLSHKTGETTKERADDGRTRVALGGGEGREGDSWSGGGAAAAKKELLESSTESRERTGFGTGRDKGGGRVTHRRQCSRCYYYAHRKAMPRRGRPPSMRTPEQRVKDWLGDEIRDRKGVASFLRSFVTLCPTRMIAAGLVLCARCLLPGNSL